MHPKEKNFSYYFYTINYPTYEESLCKTELKYLFNKTISSKCLFSNHYVDPSRSIFIKYCIKVIHSCDSLENLCKIIEHQHLCFKKYKVVYVKHEGDTVEYPDRITACNQIAELIEGTPDMHNPQIIFGITKADDKWLFGEFERNIPSWKDHEQKPCFYSNALGVRTARAVANIAVGKDINASIVDPCCGVGTVIIEALDMGLNIKGYEINPMIAKNAVRNLEFFGFQNVVSNEDMHTIEETFDISVIDLPYGLFTPATLEQQKAIIKTARRISKKMILISMEAMDIHIDHCGFKIHDMCTVSKGRFTRYIYVCT